MERAIQEIEIVIMVRTNNILFIFVELNRSLRILRVQTYTKIPEQPNFFWKKIHFDYIFRISDQCVRTRGNRNREDKNPAAVSKGLAAGK